MGYFGRRNGGGRRAAQRQKAPLVATLTTLTASHTAELVDLSLTGVRVRGDDLPGEGEDLIIGIEGIRSFGQVSWHHGDECGIAFDDPLPANDHAALCARAAQSRGFSPEQRAAFEAWTLGLAR